MKKIKLFLVISFIFVIILVVASDYYRPVYVSNKENIDFSTEEKEEIKETTQRTEKVAKILISGDNLIHENVLNFSNIKAGGKGERSTYSCGFDFTSLYEPIENEIKNADFSLCMQASLIGANDSADALSGYPSFNSPTKLAEDLMTIGFDGFNFANNHQLDMGIGGLKNAIQYWKSTKKAVFGFYENKKEFDDSANKIVVINGIKIGFVAYTATTNVPYYGNECVIPYYAVNKTAIQKELLKNQIVALKEKADVVIALMNWGNGEGFEISQHQREAAKCLADYGVDLIVGTGPKVIQGVETIQAEGRKNGVICAYSLGNMMCTMEYMQNLLGGLITFEIHKNEDGCTVKNLLFHPTIVHYDESISNISVFKLSDYSESLFYQHGSNLIKGTGSYTWLFQTVQHYIPAEFLPAALRKTSI